MAHQLNISRHQDLFDPYSFNTPIHVIGVGATGSWLTIALVKLGIEDITVWDFDVVEHHNIPNQAFGFPDIGLTKTKALSNRIEVETLTNIKTKGRYNEQRLAGIIFLLVDSMAERKRIWEVGLKLKSAVKLVIEPRLGLDMARLYNIEPTDMNHIRKYEATHYSDENAEVSACGTSLSVITSSMTTAAWCVRQLINHHNAVELDNEILIDFKFNNIISERW